ncbi:putative rrna biogenesis protein rrp5 protein [Neofusicoccum parvum UCRNP2]|uniref:rRNA biogenesis protein RRP5 n=1 Tax=Botryosphaeria parva (strain UCR-NP2) TaxID=1287680 RepID=R1EST3_BOTPV|nr:putative rrna biogenesis protein rrp5 protein [Neofusicoccum parvum UCRNP2]
MAPIKRGADSDHTASKKSKHSADERAAKRQRKSDVTPNDSKTKPEKPAEKALPVASVLKQEERSFPRGGGSVLTPLEHKQIQNDAARDVLFEQSNKRAGKGGDSDNDVDMEDAEGQKATKKKRKSKGRKSDVGEKQEEGIRIEGLSYKRVAPGSMILGQVTQITSRDIALALPNNLIGFVPLTAVSDQFTERIEALLEKEDKSDAEDASSEDDDDVELKNIFKLGQYLRAVVTSTGEDSTTAKGNKSKKKHLELSVKPQDANNRISKSDLVTNTMVQASVVSVEDHGLVMDLGLADGNIKGFISSKEVGHGVDHTNVEKGSVFLCMVTGVSSNGKIAKLSADFQKVGNVKKANFLTEAPTVDVFVPGTAVEVLVSEVTATGLAGTIMGLVDATADIVHAGAGATQQDLTTKYKIGEKVKARIICTFPGEENRKLGVSLLDHVLSLSERQAADSKAPLNILPISSIVEEAKVTKVEPTLGLFMDVGVKRVPGFAHISRLSDDKVDILSETTGAYKLNSTHRARVVGYNPVDGVYIVSLEKKILDQPFLRIEDIKVGEVVKGKVEKVMITARGSGAVVVNLADGISGLVQETHIADVHLQHPEKKYKEGLPVTARVLSTDPERRQIRLTLKKTLVNSEAPVWASYSDVQIGDQAPGTIIKILHAGAIVQFYGDLRAFLPVSEMSEAYIKDPADHFRVGQTVTVHALSVNAETDKMTVSCRDPSSRNVDQQEGYSSLQLGSIAKGVVSEKSEKNVTVELEGTTIKGILKLGHLTDGSEKKEESRMKRIRVGQTLDDLVILAKSDKRPVVTLSNKPSLVAAAQSGSLPAKFEDIKEGQTVNGFVRNIDDQRVFVEFAGGLVGLLLKSQMKEEMQKTIGYGLQNDSLVTAKILSVDQKQRRFLLTMKDDQQSPEKSASTKTSKGPASNEVLVNPIDENCKSMSDFSFGKLITTRITGVKETQLNVQLADNLFGRVDASEVFDSLEHIKDRKHPLRQFKAKQDIQVRVIGIHDAKSHRFLPISHRTSKVPVFELTAKAVKLSKESDLLSLDKLAVGSSHIAFVNNIGEHCVWVNITPNVRGRIDFMDLADDASLLNNVAANFPVGSAIKVRVKNVNASANRLDLTATSDSAVKPTAIKDLSAGMTLPARVTKVTERNIMVQLSDSVSAPVTLTEFTDDYSQANPTIYSKNDVVRVCVLDVDAPNKKLHLTMRPSKVLSSSLPVKDPQVANIRKLKVNDVVRGFVKNVAEKGLFVSLGPSVTAFVRISDLSDSFIKDWRSAFEIDQLVKGKILQVDPLLNHVQMSLKASILDKDYVPPLVFDDMKPGMVITGKVRKVEDFGVFIVVDNSKNVSGLCHRSEIADQKVEDVRKLYNEGDAVKAVVLKVDKEKHKVNFGLKASYLKNRSDDEEDSDDDGGVELDMDDSDEDEEMDDSDIDLSNVKDIESDSEEEDEDESADEMEVDSKPVNGLSTSGFDWTGSSLEKDQTAQADDSDSDAAASKKKKKSKKPTIKEDRTGDLDVYGPQSVADFERLLLGDPNNSALWMQYMAFQIGLNEVQKAREIGERALKTINIREQDEKMNIWTALLNLEIEQGNDDAVDDTFKRACEYCDTEEMHNKLISIYTSTGRHEKADSLFQRMTKIKSITPNPSFWLNYATFIMTTLNAPDRARGLLGRATQSVPPHQHRHLTAKFGALEFTSPHGDPERGRTVFEGLLATFPKRWDLWDMLVDLERSRGEKENVSKLYERMAGAKMKARRAKFVFKRWAEWEEKNGDKKGRERVEALAKEYAERLREGKDEEDEEDE